MPVNSSTFIHHQLLSLISRQRFGFNPFNLCALGKLTCTRLKLASKLILAWLCSWKQGLFWASCNFSTQKQWAKSHNILFIMSFVTKGLIFVQKCMNLMPFIPSSKWHSACVLILIGFPQSKQVFGLKVHVCFSAVLSGGEITHVLFSPKPFVWSHLLC